MNNNYKIAIMNLIDLEQIKDILDSDFDNFWNYDILKQELVCENSIYMIAKKDNILVGFIGIKKILDEADIMNIVTKKSMRNKGVASFMIKELINLCKKKNIKILNLEVNNSNLLAINLYKKYNFKQIGFRKNYYKGYQDAILMQLKISK